VTVGRGGTEGVVALAVRRDGVPREGVWDLDGGLADLEGGRNDGSGGWEEVFVEAVEVIGDHGLEDAIDVRDTLLLPTVEISALYPVDDGGLFGGVPLIVFVLSSTSRRVELFHLDLELGLIVSSAFGLLGEGSGVRLTVCLWPGDTGVVGWLDRIDENMDLLLGGGSDDGVLSPDPLLVDPGVGVAGDLPLSFLANFLSGDRLR
jgi:hypothetical protein